jgi:hypothetical protein
MIGLRLRKIFWPLPNANTQPDLALVMCQICLGGDLLVQFHDHCHPIVKGHGWGFNKGGAMGLKAKGVQHNDVKC